MYFCSPSESGFFRDCVQSWRHRPSWNSKWTNITATSHSEPKITKGKAESTNKGKQKYHRLPSIHFTGKKTRHFALPFWRPAKPAARHTEARKEHSKRLCVLRERRLPSSPDIAMMTGFISECVKNHHSNNKLSLFLAFIPSLLLQNRQKKAEKNLTSTGIWRTIPHPARKKDRPSERKYRKTIITKIPSIAENKIMKIIFPKSPLYCHTYIDYQETWINTRILQDRCIRERKQSEEAQWKGPRTLSWGEADNLLRILDEIKRNWWS